MKLKHCPLGGLLQFHENASASCVVRDGEDVGSMLGSLPEALSTLSASTSEASGSWVLILCFEPPSAGLLVDTPRPLITPCGKATETYYQRAFRLLTR